jgi:pyruvate dehydrogenase E2 component (dihydrolipoamide acetyltransferase)
MAISVVMPALEMAQETGKLVAWLKKEGDTVTKGEPLLEIETDKAVLEVEAAADGVLAGVTGETGTDVPVGQIIAWIVAPGEILPASATAPSVTPSTTEAITPALPAEAHQADQPSAPSGRISPKARGLAQAAGIDIKAIHGSGPSGEVLASDVQAFLDARTTQEPPRFSTSQHGGTPLSAIGRLMAERTTQSWTTVPHFFLQQEIDATALNSIRASLGPGVEQANGIKLTHTDLLIALVGRTLAKHPRINASWVDDGIRLNPRINVAVAIAVEDGVVAPVVPNADTASLGEIATLRRELAERARTGRLRPADLSGGTFTISNLGMFHIDSFNAIITPPQSAIIAVGRIAERVVPVGGSIGVRPRFSVTLSSDHRVIDGAKAATFLHDLADAIEKPESWLI